MPQNAAIIDAATRFLRSNPELLAFARCGAGETGETIDDLLVDAVRRVRRSGFEAIAQEEVIVGPPYRLKRRAPKSGGSSAPPVDDARPRLIVVATGDSRRDGEEEFLHRAVREQAAEQ